MILRLLVSVALSLIFCGSAFSAPDQPVATINRFIMVVPVYRELYNQNIGSLLLALHDQNLSGLGFDHIDVWLIVNNMSLSSSDIRTENQETVQFLRELETSKSSAGFERHRILAEVVKRQVSDKLNINVIDQTTPGNPERNIGKVRDFASKAALRSIAAKDLDRALIAHMDADAVFNSSYVRSIVRAFETENLKFGLLDMSYGDQFDSEAKVYQRKILADYQIAAHSFRMASDGGMPVGGTPRIVTTGSALIEVDGLPHEIVGEDTALIEILKTKFPGRGRFLDIPVEAKYRAREDGYDAAIYQRSLSHPVEFTPWMLETADMLKEVEPYLRRDPLPKSLYEEALKQHLQNHRLATIRLRSLVALYIHDQFVGGQTMVPSIHYPALIDNEWFRDLMNSKIAAHGPDVIAITAQLSKEFPYYFADPAPEEITTIARLKAATQTYLNRPFLLDARKHLSYLPTLAEKYPGTAALTLDMSFADLEARWNNALVSGRLADLAPFLGEIKSAKSLRGLPLYGAKHQKVMAKMRSDVLSLIDSGRAFSSGAASELLQFSELLEFKIPAASGRGDKNGFREPEKSSFSGSLMCSNLFAG